jgi:signal peptidase II
MTDARPNSTNARVFWGAVIVVLVLDIITKFIVERTLQVMEPRRIIGDVVRFTLVYNRGAAFSMSLGDYSRWIFGSFAVIALYILWRLHRQSAPADRLRSLALGLAWGGAAGNLIDRIRGAAGVVDFIDIGVGRVRFWTFNVADSAVTVGAILLAWVLWHEDRKPARVHHAGDSRSIRSERSEERTGT